MHEALDVLVQRERQTEPSLKKSEALNFFFFFYFFFK